MPPLLEEELEEELEELEELEEEVQATLEDLQSPLIQHSSTTPSIVGEQTKLPSGH